MTELGQPWVMISGNAMTPPYRSDLNAARISVAKASGSGQAEGVASLL
jgi:hypothetical protein